MRGMRRLTLVPSLSVSIELGDRTGLSKPHIRIRHIEKGSINRWTARRRSYCTGKVEAFVVRPRW